MADEDVDRLVQDFAAKVTLHASSAQDTDSEADEDMAPNDGPMIAGSCKCGGCRFQFSARKVLPHGSSGHLDMANCHCSPCRHAHAAAFASYVTVPTAAVERLKGADLVEARRDRCKHLNADVLRIFCGKCFSCLAMLPKVGKEVHICAGSLE
ncbi:AQP4, partial [Symbiodinium pilosum]